MRKWLARLSFSFLILALLLIWQGYKEIAGGRPYSRWRIGLYFLAAGISFGLSVLGVRERHRSDEDDRPPRE